MKLNQNIIENIIKKSVTVHLYDSIDSTNNEAKRRADIDHGIHLYASSRQTAGRGRRGNRFYSPENTGLYMTLSLPLADGAANVQKITCAAAVAVCEAIEALSVVRPQIKWVNDIFVGGKKAGGILTELITDSDNRPTAVIIGIGLNLNTEFFPAEIADKAGNIGDIDINMLCAAIVNNMLKLFEDLADTRLRLEQSCNPSVDIRRQFPLPKGASNNNSVIEKYKRLNLCIGHNVRFTKGGTEHTAKAVGIADDGGLIVEENGGITVLNSGEISVVL